MFGLFGFVVIRIALQNNEIIVYLFVCILYIQNYTLQIPANTTHNIYRHIRALIGYDMEIWAWLSSKLNAIECGWMTQISYHILHECSLVLVSLPWFVCSFCCFLSFSVWQLKTAVNYQTPYPLQIAINCEWCS